MLLDVARLVGELFCQTRIVSACVEDVSERRNSYLVLLICPP